MQPTFKNYLTGFILSIGLTLVAYLSVVNHLLSGGSLIAAIFALALIQLIVQLLYFLHLGPGSRDELIFFIATIGIILIIVGGSLWIIEELNFNMTPQQINDYMKDQGSF